MASPSFFYSNRNLIALYPWGKFDQMGFDAFKRNHLFTRRSLCLELRLAQNTLVTDLKVTFHEVIYLTTSLVLIRGILERTTEMSRGH